MKASEILHGLAELLAGIETGQGQEMGQQPTATMTTVEVPNVDHAEGGRVFVPPLQAKLELLKKAVDVDSIYDQQGGDEIEHIKKMAGLHPVVADEASSDEPLDV
jgi:hypothetical protein